MVNWVIENLKMNKECQKFCNKMMKIIEFCKIKVHQEIVEY